MQTEWVPSTKIVGMVWIGVFTSTYPMYYEVTAKLARAEADLIQWQKTTNTELHISLDTSNIVENTGVDYVTVMAISSCELFTTGFLFKFHVSPFVCFYFRCIAIVFIVFYDTPRSFLDGTTAVVRHFKSIHQLVPPILNRNT